jgi:hypothetical protein
MHPRHPMSGCCCHQPLLLLEMLQAASNCHQEVRPLPAAGCAIAVLLPEGQGLPARPPALPPQPLPPPPEDPSCQSRRHQAREEPAPAATTAAVIGRQEPTTVSANHCNCQAQQPFIGTSSSAAGLSLVNKQDSQLFQAVHGSPQEQTHDRRSNRSCRLSVLTPLL